MTKIFLALILAASSAFGAIPTSDFEFLFNRLPGEPLARKYLLGTMVREGYGQAVCIYEKTTLGGAIGTVNLVQANAGSLPVSGQATITSAQTGSAVTPCTLPAKAVVRSGMIDVITTLVGASATLSLGLNTTSDIKASTAIASFTGQMDVVPVYTAATAVKITTAKTLTLTIGTTALTAGKFRVFLNYVQSE